MLPDAVHDEGVVTHSPTGGCRCQQASIGRLGHLETAPPASDPEFLNEIYERSPLHQLVVREKRPGRNGLCEYQHPYSSGLDNSPLFDDGCRSNRLISIPI